jgi:Cu(I)/Ag(I) efflux system protein CusF
MKGNTMKTYLLPLYAAALFSGPLSADPVQPGTMQPGTMQHGSMMNGSTMQPSAMQNSPMASGAVMSDGVVRKIDLSAGKITIKHGPLVNLDMPGMTMVFRVQSPELLEKVKAGDTVKFHAEDINGVLTVTAIEKVQ